MKCKSQYHNSGTPPGPQNSSMVFFIYFFGSQSIGASDERLQITNKWQYWKEFPLCWSTEKSKYEKCMSYDKQFDGSRFTWCKMCHWSPKTTLLSVQKQKHATIKTLSVHSLFVAMVWIKDSAFVTGTNPSFKCIGSSLFIYLPSTVLSQPQRMNASACVGAVLSFCSFCFW